MTFIKTSASALGKLIVAAALAATFLSGLIGVVYLSLRGEEVIVPEVVGKDFYERLRNMVKINSVSQNSER